MTNRQRNVDTHPRLATDRPKTNMPGGKLIIVSGCIWPYQIETPCFANGDNKSMAGFAKAAAIEGKVKLLAVVRRKSSISCRSGTKAKTYLPKQNRTHTIPPKTSVPVCSYAGMCAMSFKVAPCLTSSVVHPSRKEVRGKVCCSSVALRNILSIVALVHRPLRAAELVAKRPTK